jgi:hypothetical protein
VLLTWTAGASAAPQPVYLVGDYRFEEASCNGTAGELLDVSGQNNNGKAIGTTFPTPSTANPAHAVPIGSTSGTCNYSRLPGRAVSVSSAEPSTSPGSPYPPHGSR